MGVQQHFACNNRIAIPKAAGMMKFVLAIVVLAAIVIQDASSDVARLSEVRADRQYLPPHDQHPEKSTQYAPYKVMKAKGIADPPLVHHERPRFSPGGRLSSTVRPISQLFTKAARATQHSPVYTSAPNSVFHTQINVQSQGSEFNAPNAARQTNIQPQTDAFEPFSTIRNQNLHLDKNSDLAALADQPGSDEAPNNEVPNGEFRNNEDPNGNADHKILSMPAGKSQRRPVNRPGNYGLHGKRERPASNGAYRCAIHNQGREDTYDLIESKDTDIENDSGPKPYSGNGRRNGNTAPRSFGKMNNGVYESGDNEPGGSLSSSCGSPRSHERKGSVVGRKRPQQRNYQGLNLIGGNMVGDRGAHAQAPRPPANYNSNIQGTNIINGNLLANDNADGTIGEGDFDTAASSHSPHRIATSGGRRDDDTITLHGDDTFEVIYRPGDNQAYLEGTSSEFGDTSAFVDTAASTTVGTSQGQCSDGHCDDTDLRDDGYHYNQPSIIFRT